MRLHNHLITAVILLVLTTSVFGQTNGQNEPSAFKTIEFKSLDGLPITADLYRISDNDAPYIILFHQARYSRGEYREIGPKLNAMGYNCIAVDQRSGDSVKNVVNQTHLRAVEKSLSAEYTDALPDMEATLFYVKNKLKAKKIIVWGSSYSSALVFVLAAKYPDDIDAVLSFSPGDYFTIDGKNISDFAMQVSCPVFITSAKNEQSSWQPIYDNLPVGYKSYFLPDSEGYHGSKALWEDHPGHKQYWEAVMEFLNGISS